MATMEPSVQKQVHDVVAGKTTTNIAGTIALVYAAGQSIPANSPCLSNPYEPKCIELITKIAASKEAREKADQLKAVLKTQ
jgi:hypothetical protein